MMRGTHTQTEFRPTFPSILLFEVDVDAVHETGIYLGGTCQAYTQSEVVKSGDANPFIVNTLENARDGGQED